MFESSWIDLVRGALLVCGSCVTPLERRLERGVARSDLGIVFHEVGYTENYRKCRKTELNERSDRDCFPDTYNTRISILQLLVFGML